MDEQAFGLVWSGTSEGSGEGAGRRDRPCGVEEELWRGAGYGVAVEMVLLEGSTGVEGAGEHKTRHPPVDRRNWCPTPAVHLDDMANLILIFMGLFVVTCTGRKD